MTTPTQRTLKECRERGWLAHVVEQLIKFGNFKDGERPGVRRDMFGFVDVVAIVPNENKLVFIQSTSAGHISHRRTKILTECLDSLNAVLACGVRVEIWGWKKYKKPVNRKWWQVKIEEIAPNTQPTQ